jgi:hypothetical protein
VIAGAACLIPARLFACLVAKPVADITVGAVPARYRAPAAAIREGIIAIRRRRTILTAIADLLG